VVDTNAYGLSLLEQRAGGDGRIRLHQKSVLGLAAADVGQNAVDETTVGAADFDDGELFVAGGRRVRAVGAANGSNPVAIIVPCHRVIGSSGKLTGYGGGLPMKKRLLKLNCSWTMGLRM